MCQWASLLVKKKKKNVPLMSDVDNEGVCECAGAEDLRQTSVPFSQFCYKPKTALKTCL